MPNTFQGVPTPPDPTKPSLFDKLTVFLKQKAGSTGRSKLRRLMLRNQRWFHKNSERPDEWFCNAREQEIFRVLREFKRPMTDREIATILKFSDMNAVRPRITEAISKGYLEEVDNVKDAKTNKEVRRVRLTANPQSN